jgi:hypothetical protein
MHKCAICCETFNQFFLFTMHNEGHKISAKSHSVQGPYTKAEKALIVARGESRLGAHNFYGN